MLVFRGGRQFQHHGNRTDLTQKIDGTELLAMAAKKKTRKLNDEEVE